MNKIAKTLAVIIVGLIAISPTLEARRHYHRRHHHYQRDRGWNIAVPLMFGMVAAAAASSNKQPSNRSLQNDIRKLAKQNEELRNALNEAIKRLRADSKNLDKDNDELEDIIKKQNEELEKRIKKLEAAKVA